MWDRGTNYRAGHAGSTGYSWRAARMLAIDDALNRASRVDKTQHKAGGILSTFDIP
jgi:hypothetical protein